MTIEMHQDRSGKKYYLASGTSKNGVPLLAEGGTRSLAMANFFILLSLHTTDKSGATQHD